MIHIKYSIATDQYYVIESAGNHEVLNTGELVKTKQSAWKNIKAVHHTNHNFPSQRKKFGRSDFILVQDDSVKTPVQYELYPDGRKLKREKFEIVICNITL